MANMGLRYHYHGIKTQFSINRPERSPKTWILAFGGKLVQILETLKRLEFHQEQQN